MAARFNLYNFVLKCITSYTIITNMENVENNSNIESKPFSIVVPLGYGLIAPVIGKLSEDIDTFGGKKGDLVLSYYLMKEKLKPGESIPSEIKDNLDNLNSVNLIITKEYAKKLKDLLEDYINKA